MTPATWLPPWPWWPWPSSSGTGSRCAGPLGRGPPRGQRAADQLAQRVVHGVGQLFEFRQEAPTGQQAEGEAVEVGEDGDVEPGPLGDRADPIARATRLAAVLALND